MQRLVENNNVSEPEDGWSSSKKQRLSSKIKEALNVGSSGKSQFTFENEEFVVSASFLGDFSDEEVSSNPVTTVKRGELDFEDLHDVHLLDESIGDNIDAAAQIGNEFTKTSHPVEEEGVSTPLQIGENSNPSNDATQLAFIENDTMATAVGKDVTEDESAHHVYANNQRLLVEEEELPTPLYKDYTAFRNNEGAQSENDEDGKSETVIEKDITKEEAQTVDKSYNQKIVENTCVNTS